MFVDRLLTLLRMFVLFMAKRAWTSGSCTFPFPLIAKLFCGATVHQVLVTRTDNVLLEFIIALLLPKSYVTLYCNAADVLAHIMRATALLYRDRHKYYLLTLLHKVEVKITVSVACKLL